MATACHFLATACHFFTKHFWTFEKERASGNDAGKDPKNIHKQLFHTARINEQKACKKVSKSFNDNEGDHTRKGRVGALENPC